ncbi:hypothetical protein B0H14DRAFT_3499397 [Mycena olivaceomarginata]|nr:hypothetical protein B0H14DRAFT_3499397 [Mycena olivaceomarginata]
MSYYSGTNDFPTPPVVDAPSVQNGVDLLKNRNEHSTHLGPFDGRVGAHVAVASTSCFITTNATYVPGFPPAGDNLVLRRDMRWGPDDPTLWPHQYSDRFSHLGAIPRRPTTAEGRKNLGIMWWNPGPDDFVSPETEMTVSRGLGKLSGHRIAAISPRVHELLGRCRGYQITTCPPESRALFTALMDSLRRGLDRLCSIPATFERMVLGVTNVQRTYLELTGLLEYLSVYKPRMLDASRLGGLTEANVLGVFTSDPVVAENFHRARLPFWYIRPLSALYRENILKVVVPLDPAQWMELGAVEGFLPIQGGPTLESRIEALHRGTSTLPWYKNPFASGDTAKAIEMSAPAPVAGPSRAIKTSAPAAVAVNSPAARTSSSGNRFQPYARMSSQAHQSSPPKSNAEHGRNKYVHLNSPYMAEAIPAWAAALAAVDRSRPPICGPSPRNYYVFPEPALLIASESRRDLYIHHYQLIRDALLYRQGDVAVSNDPLSPAEWRDVLQGKVVTQGKSGSLGERRTSSIERILAPAMRACNLTTLDNFPEITWQLAEMNFRYELCALDEAACGLDRHEKCLEGFPGGLLAPELSEGLKGLAAVSPSERLPSLLHLARLMRDWSYRPRPEQLALAVAKEKGETLAAAATEEGEIEDEGDWSDAAILKLEEAVARYYTSAFFHFHGRAAVVPLRLQREDIATNTLLAARV